ncbi:sensor histidine kinase [Romboutsia sp. 1001216sp1]|uniref:sensor histidine kinase n=1 Tax=Romboutsia sp. 1001216sp1 TaxID=2986997 RepID=UPI00232B1738|nr:sensor histidine kinase [Romboutsia sp. 1001216sp1]MDB8803930.1 sensor histidine kinase [Romboutsia sp. 1001216sp1]MDB8806720.1 sensor histidine kinase [Romboutsia sp. 1001216sp1]MDB8809577.1 sensor histidine kinase [Romboutsia sp. 1001216sp1]MDB8815326.1 sensor histidine kinase [Romboutsia sp. 1001216sp1]MDB8818019.1 sensor histidine kinase [Romboutsia sp. 1001216sp1]
MSVYEYLKQRTLFFIVNIVLFLITASIMLFVKVNISIITMVFLIWFTPISIYILMEMIKHKKYYDELVSISENLDKKYLISEVISEPEFIEGKLVYNILKSSNRNMQEHVKYFKNMQSEYQEYIETWVHEIKTPIASLMLIVENHEDNIPNSMKYEVKKIENYIDQVLYYSRSNDVSKDYIIKKFNLERIIRCAIRKNASDFINKRIGIDIKEINFNVYSDEKWVEFILNQIINNAIKYSKESEGKVSINAVKNKNNIILSIKDNGVGINEKDIDRVFEKGFTGENGRIFGKSTGIGLYLCKKLCDKLGLGINIVSKQQEGTEIRIIFPVGKDDIRKN